MNNGLGLYIHVPFCKKKCKYCDFTSYQGQESKISEYVECLKREIGIISEQCKEFSIKTIFIGGGTPSYITEKYISSILNECKTFLSLRSEIEISLETNPGTLNEEKLRTYKEAGVNRLSIGLQAYQDQLLDYIGRIHNYGEFLDSYQLARQVGFRNINIDLIFGLPGQTSEQWEKTLHEILVLKPDHISCYSLKIEKNTPFYDIYGSEVRGEKSEVGSRRSEVRYELPSEDEEREMYHLAVSLLESNGYRHYEISNFCLPGYECRHNLIYWKCEPYIGIGAGAHSYFQNKRFSNEPSLERYINQIRSGKLPRHDYQEINVEERMAEFMILGFRLKDGIGKDEFHDRFGCKIEDIYGTQISKLQEQGLIDNTQDRVQLTTKGLDLANLVMVEFI